MVASSGIPEAQEILVGNSLVLYKPEVQAKLEGARNNLVDPAALTCQRALRGGFARSMRRDTLARLHALPASARDDSTDEFRKSIEALKAAAAPFKPLYGSIPAIARDAAAADSIYAHKSKEEALVAVMRGLVARPAMEVAEQLKSALEDNGALKLDVALGGTSYSLEGVRDEEILGQVEAAYARVQKALEVKQAFEQGIADDDKELLQKAISGRTELLASDAVEASFMSEHVDSAKASLKRIEREEQHVMPILRKGLQAAGAFGKKSQGGGGGGLLAAAFGGGKPAPSAAENTDPTALNHAVREVGDTVTSSCKRAVAAVRLLATVRAAVKSNDLSTVDTLLVEQWEAQFDPVTVAVDLPEIPVVMAAISKYVWGGGWVEGGGA